MGRRDMRPVVTMSRALMALDHPLRLIQNINHLVGGYGAGDEIRND
jgi:hypothetical protein